MLAGQCYLELHGNQSVRVHRTAPAMVFMVFLIQLSIDETGMCRVPPDWSAIISHRVTEGQGWCTMSFRTAPQVGPANM